MPKLHRIIPLAFLAMLSGCTYRQAPLTLQLKMDIPRSRSGPAGGGMDCYFAAISGGDLPTGAGATGSLSDACFGFGVLSELVGHDQFSSSGAKLTVPPGYGRTVTVYGVKAQDGNGCTGRTRFPDFGTTRPALYVLGEAKADLLQNTTVHVKYAYDAATATDLVGQCLPAVSPTSGLAIQNVSGGPVAAHGGDPITINGSGFTASASVMVDGVAADFIAVLAGGTQLQVHSPAHSVGAVPVTVTLGGSSVTLDNALTYTVSGGGGAPAITQLNPTQGPLGGGYDIEIDGTNFIYGMTGVQFAGNSGTIQVLSSSKLKVTVPQGSVTGAVTVDLNVGSLQTSYNSFTYTTQLPPSISEVFPSHISSGGNTAIVLYGSNFFNSGSGLEVFINTTSACTVLSVTSNKVICNAPAITTAGSQMYFVEVINPDAQSFNSSITYIDATSGTNPAFLSVNPNAFSASSPTALTIGGSGFDNPGGVTAHLIDVTGTSVACVAAGLSSANGFNCGYTGGLTAGLADLLIENASSGMGVVVPNTITLQ